MNTIDTHCTYGLRCKNLRYSDFYEIMEDKMNEISIKAYAKINLGLDVIRKREDGYHELKMIMQTINLYDTLTLTATEEPGIQLHINLSSLPCNENNLVVKAAKLMMDTYHITQGVKIELLKHIPIAAGMAGGSADAAATLKAMNELFQLGASREDLMRLGVTLGADIPYCIMEGTALSEGIGEVLTPLPAMPSCHILVVKPNVNVSTKFVYQNLKINENTKHPDIDGMVASIHKNDLHGIIDRLGNVLETVTIPKHPKVEQIKKDMLNMGALGTLMSGSGPTVFGIFRNYSSAKRCYDAFKRSPYKSQTFLTLPYQPEISKSSASKTKTK